MQQINPSTPALLATFVAIIGSIVLGVKKNVLWKKWLSSVGIAFVVCIIGAANAPTNTNNKNALTAPTTQQQTQSQPAPQSQPQPQAGQQSQPEQQPQTEQAKTSASQVQVQSEQQPSAKAATPPPQSTAPATVKTPAPQAQKQDMTVYITGVSGDGSLTHCQITIGPIPTIQLLDYCSQ